DTLNTITKMLHWNKNEITYYDHNAKSFYSLKIDSGFDERKITNLNQLTYEDFDYAETGQTTHGFNIIEQTDYDF
ncbi:MAG: hypothetical protein J0G32_08425, partial [Alphaproteobacteria bacterium]|nr:hypothetical protein [Alphaproteobacteria bacterium]